MLIDTNQDKLEDLESQIDILSIVGSCTSIGALKMQKSENVIYILL